MNFLDLKHKSPTQKMVFAAIMAGIAVILNYLEIPYTVPYLRFDLSEAIVVIVVLLVGLRYGLMVSLIKATIFFISGSNGNDPIGTVVLLFSSCLIAVLFYLLTRKLSLIVSLILLAIIFSITMTSINYFITLPIYMATSFSELNSSPEYLKATVALYMPFNLIKIFLVSVVVLLLNKVLFKVDLKNAL